MVFRKIIVAKHETEWLISVKIETTGFIIKKMVYISEEFCLKYVLFFILLPDYCKCNFYLS